MKNYKFILAFVLCIGSLGSLTAATFSGRVVDEKGAPIAYATVYPEIAPEWGTATNNDGFFSFEANLMPDMKTIISFIGYEKLTIRANECQILSPSKGEPEGAY